MKRGLLLSGILLLAIFLISCAPPAPKVLEESVAVKLPEEVPETTPIAEEKPTLTEEVTEDKANNVVKITSSGFEPKTLTVKAGTTVTFVNEDSNKHWPASAMHPTHTLYPGSGIEKCGTGEEIFDTCKGLAQGESFSFTFNEKGSWKYHDHLKVSSTGTIIVE